MVTAWVKINIKVRLWADGIDGGIVVVADDLDSIDIKIGKQGRIKIEV